MSVPAFNNTLSTYCSTASPETVTISIYQAMNTRFAKIPAGKVLADNRLTSFEQVLKQGKNKAGGIVSGSLHLLAAASGLLQPAAEIIVAGEPGGSIYPVLHQQMAGGARCKYCKFSDASAVFSCISPNTSLVWVERNEDLPVKISTLKQLATSGISRNFVPNWIVLLNQHIYSPLFRWELRLRLN